MLKKICDCKFKIHTISLQKQNLRIYILLYWIAGFVFPTWQWTVFLKITIPAIQAATTKVHPDLRSLWIPIEFSPIKSQNISLKNNFFVFQKQSAFEKLRQTYKSFWFVNKLIIYGSALEWPTTPLNIL